MTHSTAIAIAIYFGLWVLWALFALDFLRGAEGESQSLHSDNGALRQHRARLVDDVRKIKAQRDVVAAVNKDLLQDRDRAGKTIEHLRKKVMHLATVAVQSAKPAAKQQPEPEAEDPPDEATPSDDPFIQRLESSLEKIALAATPTKGSA